MRKFFVVLAALTAIVFVIGCGGGSGNSEENTKPDNDQTEISDGDTGISDAETPDDDSDNPQEPDENSDDIDNIDDNEISDEDSDNPQEPDEDSDDISDIEISDEDSDTEEPEVTENHKISGILQAGSAVSNVKAALVECGKTEEIASANTDADGKFSFNADIAETKTYCVKANGFASCFKGMTT